MTDNVLIIVNQTHQTTLTAPVNGEQNVTTAPNITIVESNSELIEASEKPNIFLSFSTGLMFPADDEEILFATKNDFQNHFDPFFNETINMNTIVCDDCNNLKACEDDECMFYDAISSFPEGEVDVFYDCQMFPDAAS